MAKKSTPDAPAPQKKHHIPVVKDGATIHIHPDQLEQHQRLGWSVVEAGGEG